MAHYTTTVFRKPANQCESSLPYACDCGLCVLHQYTYNVPDRTADLFCFTVWVPCVFSTPDLYEVGVPSARCTRKKLENTAVCAMRFGTRQLAASEAPRECMIGVIPLLTNIPAHATYICEGVPYRHTKSSSIPNCLPNKEDEAKKCGIVRFRIYEPRFPIRRCNFCFVVHFLI